MPGRLLPLVLVFSALSSIRAGEGTLVGPEKKIFELTNQERKKKELPPFKLSANLQKVARAHSENMAKQGKMEHNLDGMTPMQRVRAAGYAYARIHENIGAGDPEVPIEDLMKAWMDSEGHRA